jgi:hypothetical protein
MKGELVLVLMLVIERSKGEAWSWERLPST